MSLTILLAAVVAAAWTLTACAPGEAKSGKSGEEIRSSRPTDETITGWVESALRMDPRVSASDVQAKTLDGIVTLHGTVGDVQEKNFATMEVKKIDGVRGVIDELSVPPSGRPDKQIKEDVVRRLTQSPGVRCRDLIVDVADGAVTLRGEVPTLNELEYANTLAGEVSGVRNVTNEMVLSFDRPLTDEQNRDEIVAAIDRDPYLTGLPITVRVADGNATLEGSVGNAYEKDRAEMDAFHVASVDLVDNRLTIDWTKNRGVRDHQPLMTSDQVGNSVRESLDQDLRLRTPDEIMVDVTDRDVTLGGTVPDYYQEMIAQQDAQDVVGVQEVFDHLEVDLTNRDDDAIADSLNRRFATDYDLADRSIDVFVHDGMATLTGTVHSPFDKDHAREVAASVLGVRGVINDIMVRPPVGYSDEALKEGIEARLSANWKTRPVAPRIGVRVEDGNVTLTGDVDSWIERLEAGRVASLVDGVVGVDNDLMLLDMEPPAVSQLHRPDEDPGD